MAKTMLEIEIDGEKNQNHFFRPLQQKIRGRFDAVRLARHDDGAGKLARKWPDAIPGQRLQLDIDGGKGAIVEPLHDADFASIKTKIEKAGYALPAERQEVANVDPCTWLFWMRSAVQAGIAKVTQGTLPTDAEIEKLGTPQTSFIVSRKPDANDKLADGFNRLASAIEKQTELLTKLVTKGS